jgi:hypothetical protein
MAQTGDSGRPGSAGGYSGGGGTSGSGTPLNDDVTDYSALQGGGRGTFNDGGDLGGGVEGNDICGCTSGEPF